MSIDSNFLTCLTFGPQGLPCKPDEARANERGEAGQGGVVRAHSTDRRDLAMAAGDLGRWANARNMLSQAPRFLPDPAEASAMVDAMEEAVKGGWHAIARGAGVSEADCATIANAFVYLGAFCMRAAAARSFASGEGANRVRTCIEVRGFAPVRAASVCEGIKDRDACPGDVGDVPRDERQVVDFGGCRQQPIDQRQWIGDAQERPGLGNGLVDRKHTISKAGPRLREPPVKAVGLIGIVAALQFDTTPNFGEDNDARADVLHRRLGNPFGDVRMRPLSLADLGNDVCIEEEFQNSTSRQPFWRG